MESAFQFTDPSLSNLEFVINEEFDSRENEKVKIQTSISVEVKRNKKENKAIVSLMVEIGNKSKNMPFWIKAIEQANFKWSENIDEANCECLLNQNAPSLLLSYLRPIIAQITLASQYGAYHIPFINFTRA